MQWPRQDVVRVQMPLGATRAQGTGLANVGLATVLCGQSTSQHHPHQCRSETDSTNDLNLARTQNPYAGLEPRLNPKLGLKPRLNPKLRLEPMVLN